MYNTAVRAIEQLDDIIRKAISFIPESFGENVDIFRKTVVNSDIQLQILLVLIIWFFINISLIFMFWKKYESILSDKVGSTGTQKLLKKSFLSAENLHFKEE